MRKSNSRGWRSSFTLIRGRDPAIDGYMVGWSASRPPGFTPVPGGVSRYVFGARPPISRYGPGGPAGSRRSSPSHGRCRRRSAAPDRSEASRLFARLDGVVDRSSDFRDRGDSQWRCGGRTAAGRCLLRSRPSGPCRRSLNRQHRRIAPPRRPPRRRVGSPPPASRASRRRRYRFLWRAHHVLHIRRRRRRSPRRRSSRHGNRLHRRLRARHRVGGRRRRRHASPLASRWPTCR